MADGAALVATIRVGHPQFTMLSQRAGHEWHEYLACKTCRVAWPCEAIAAADVIEAHLARIGVLEAVVARYSATLDLAAGWLEAAAPGGGATELQVAHRILRELRAPIRETLEVGNGPHD